MSQRNTRFVIGESLPNYRLACEHGLVHNHIHKRNGNSLLLDNGLEAIDFINCSYLGIDCHPKVVEAYNSVHKSLGVNFCCARTRLTDFSLKSLEDRLTTLSEGTHLLYRKAGVLVGHANFVLDINEVLKLENYYVHIWVDQNQGREIRTKVISHFFKRTENLNLDCTAGISVNNGKSIRVFEKAGFKPKMFSVGIY